MPKTLRMMPMTSMVAHSTNWFDEWAAPSTATMAQRRLYGRRAVSERELL
jgi:hypothetical protein